MSASRADVPTALGSRYLQQLCKHWSHKFTVDFTPTEGTIDFGDGRRCGLTAADDSLIVRAEAPQDALAQFQVIIEKHLQRFAHREGELAFDWRPVAG